jgi:CRP/FNR family transcriptional regulator, cyclic AMP receptor protein
MHDDTKVERLAAIPLFATLTRKHLRRVAALSTTVIAEPGRVLCRQDELGAEFFVVDEGRFRVEVGGRAVATLGAGEFFGELALLDGGRRTATVVAETTSRVLVVDHAQFGAMLREEPEVAVRMLAPIGARMRRLAESVKEPVCA